MRKHTPGPWTATKYIVHKVGGGWVADCSGHGGAECEYCNANAQLIAAAPEMLEALEYVKGHVMHLPIKVHALVMAAIAKAEGKP